MANGHGISDAVRGAINDWMVPEILTPVSKALGKQVQGWQVNDAKQWVRKARRYNTTGAGWERDYVCKSFGPLGLRVVTNDSDTHISYVTFRVNGKVIAGGAVNVPSVNISQAGYDATIQDLKKVTVTATVGGKTVAKAEGTVISFKPFTAKQLAQFEAELEFGAAGLIDRLMDERV
jgi:hypothetical protein